MNDGAPLPPPGQALIRPFLGFLLWLAVTIAGVVVCYAFAQKIVGLAMKLVHDPLSAAGTAMVLAAFALPWFLVGLLGGLITKSLQIDSRPWWLESAIPIAVILGVLMIPSFGLPLALSGLPAAAAVGLLLGQSILGRREKAAGEASATQAGAPT